MVRQKPIACLHLALFYAVALVFLAMPIVATTTINIGGLFPLTTTGNRASGRQNLAAVLLAIDQVNNKSDSINDALLENYNVCAGFVYESLKMHFFTCSLFFMQMFFFVSFF